MLLKARESQDSEAYAPPLATWTPEAELLADAIYELRKLYGATLAAGGHKNPPKPVPVARPKTAMDRVKRRERQEKHERLANRVLARRRQQPPPDTIRTDG